MGANPIGALVLAAVVLLSPRPASAEVGAAALLREGNRLFNSARYAEADELFARAYQQHRASVFLRSRAYCKLKLYRHEEAWRLLGEYLERFPRAGDAQRLRGLQTRLANALRTRVEIWSTPPGASVYIDTRAGGVIGKTPGSWTIEPGQHQVFLEAPGHASGKVWVMAEQDRVARVRVQLRRLDAGAPPPTVDEALSTTPEQAAAPQGLLTMRSVPSGAEVRFGGRRLGRTPLERAAVVAGTRRLTVTGGDGREVAVALRVPAGGEVEGRAVLPRSRAPMIAGIVATALGAVLATAFAAVAWRAQTADGCTSGPGGDTPNLAGGSCNLRTFSIIADVSFGLAGAGALTTFLGYLWARPSFESRTR